MGIVIGVVLLELVFVFAYITERSLRVACWLDNVRRRIDLS